MSHGPGSPAPLARGDRAAVVAPHHLATSAGLEVLRRGGSAVDAAIATNAALAVVAPNTCGLGGDAFWLIWDEAGGALHALAGAGAAARRSDPDRLRAAGLTRLPIRGPLPITVPGAVRSWRDAHARFGAVDLSVTLEPAIELATDGFPAWGGFARKVEKTAEAIVGEPWSSGFTGTFRPHGRAWIEGEIVRLPALAATLRRLSEAGLDDLYEGQVAMALVDALETAGSTIRADDLADQASRWGKPLVRRYRGVEVATHPLPSCGVVGLLLLAVLERVAAPSPGVFGGRGWPDARWPHAGIEAAKLALAVREALLGDPDFVAVDESVVLADDAIGSLVSRIDPDRAALDTPAITTLVGGTAYIAAVDEAGNAASLISSNATDFGSGVVDPLTGIAFHDRGQGFSLDPDHPNALVPGKRPLHSLLPGMILRDGRPWIVVGSMGGDSQPQILAQVVSAVVDGGTDIGTAISAPRWSVEPRDDVGRPIEVLVERGFDPAVATRLVGLGHALRSATEHEVVGHCHAIELRSGPSVGGEARLTAATDPRSEGAPAVD
ncbi:MAG TPA: gamma-glutamyltransferase [Candidatus Limnocylindrales bacterium]|nr:gamma-glutamyltransferase [Candidatus Limnocylindrales bacterium]